MKRFKIHCLCLSFFLFNTFAQADNSNSQSMVKNDTVIPAKKDTESVLKAIIDSNRVAIDSNQLFAQSRIRSFIARQKDSLDKLKADSILKASKTKPK